MKHLAAMLTVVSILLTVGLISLIPARRKGLLTGETVLVLGTFHNRGWIDAHLQPLLAADQVARVIVIHDDQFLDHPKLEIHTPMWVQSGYLASRIGKLVSFFSTAVATKPTVYMGYSIMPNALYALILARIFGGRSLYQMTGGPIEYEDGGYQNVNSLMRHMVKPSPVLNHLFRTIVKKFDHVIVRGDHARRFLARDVGERVSILTGAISDARFQPAKIRDIDLIHVSRLVPRKGIFEFLNVVRHLKTSQGEVKAMIIGDGPMAQEVAARVAELDLSNEVQLPGRLTDPETYLGRAKLFMLLSESEGMSIALLEAMSCGCVPIVTDVGELADAVTPETGFLLSDVMTASDVATSALSNPDNLAHLSLNARQLILNQKSYGATAGFWNQLFSNTLPQQGA